ncbi:copper amine oxidase N-terminal domain-containing protein [Calidifontibacillus oryziterrae]|uniref:copper amine oxidase N-terminal domain-containing protein n=1 Tax=Calidifontibacillus oryziterrae TaxID=1191699 RepID=UPI00030B9762|nr:copper amine oxidase N-terminal domain-containing protein [Calidifontibacillus oryziterrae]
MSNQPKFKKAITVMTSAALTAGVVAPIVAPMDASANSNNLVDKVLHVDSDYVSGAAAANHLIIKEKDVNFATNDTFRLSLPSGVKWVKDSYSEENIAIIKNDGTKWDVVNVADQDAVDALDVPAFQVVQVTAQDLELKIVGDWEETNPSSVHVPLFFEVDGAEGEVKVTVDAKGSTLTSSQQTIAIVADGNTSTTISEVKTIGDGDAIGTIRIDELALDTLEEGNDVTLRLPKNFKWTTEDGVTAKATFTGGFTGSANLTVGDDKVTFELPARATASKLTTIYIEGLAIDADNKAPYGDITVEVSGDVTDQDIVVAKYADYSSEISVDDEVPTLFAGRNNVDTDDLETAEITIKEEVAGSWLSSRDVQIEFPSWVKVVGYEVSGVKGFTSNTSAETKLQNDLFAEVTGDSNEIELSSLPAGSDKREFKVKFYVSTKADAQGDITAKFSGKAGIEGEVVVAKAVAPVNVEFEKTNVRTGIKGQAIGDITVTEAAKGALIKGKDVTLQLSDGVKFSGKPSIEVVEGNLEIDESTINVNNGELTFTIDSESTRASQIKISNVKVDLDRTVPEGDIDVEVGGDALVQNADLATGTAFDSTDLQIGEKTFPSFDLTTSSIEVGEFDKNYVMKKAIATVVTPAEGNQTVGEVVFTVGGTTYTENGVEKTMDVAPFIEASRTYLPVRYVAKAVGVEGENILWDEATRKVTILKDGRVAQLTIGSNILTVNGAQIPMDVKAKVVDGRTVLPLRAVAQALGAQVDWNEADQTVTVK